MKTLYINRLRQFGSTLVVLTALTGCGWVHEGIPECPPQLRVRFVYDYNMKLTDSFSEQVKSVNIWAFDAETGVPLWQGSASGSELAAADGFAMDTPLEAGKYDFVSWCGLLDGSPFELADYHPQSKEDLEVKLRLVQEAQQSVSDTELPGLFHGSVLSYILPDNTNKLETKEVTVSLTKDTNIINVILQSSDGHAIGQSDFSVEITDANSNLAWNNAVLPGPEVTYLPWATGNGDTWTARDAASDPLFYSRFSMSRLVDGQAARLTVVRNSDNQAIINIPLIDYLLLVKDEYGSMSNQEFLDRQDEYTIRFLIDNSNTWYIAGGIFINSWAVVPPQTTGSL